MDRDIWWATDFGAEGEESACNVGDPGSIPGSGRSPGEGNGSPLQYFCLENPHGQRRLAGYSPQCPKESDATEQFCVHIHMISYLTHLFF